MANASLRFEDRLEGTSNFSAWRECIALVLEEQGLWEFVEGTAVLPGDPTQQPIHLKKDVKSRRIIIDRVKDHIIPHLSRKKTTKDMWEALIKLYQSNNQSRKMLLKEKLESTKIAREILLQPISPSSLRSEMSWQQLGRQWMRLGW
jgi:hypothetical protein